MTSNSAGRVAASLSLLAAAALGACENLNPLSRDDFFIPIASDEHRYRIDSIDLAEHSRSDPVTIDEAAAAMMDQRAAAPALGSGESLEITLAQVRAAALANNLDLRVTLYEPLINETFIGEEEARFEWTLLASARRNRADSPTSSTLTSAQATIDDFDLGVRIPLRTGGTVNVNLPINRTKTNNIFSTLNPSYTTDLRFSISQPLLRGAGVRPNTHGIRVAKYQGRIVDAQTKLEAIRILAGADRVYWQLYAARRALEVAQQQYEVAVEQMNTSKRFFEQGQGPMLDVIRAESGIAQRLEAIIVTERGVLQRQRDLKRIMNRDDLPINSAVLLVPVTDPNPVKLDLDADALADIGVDHRMEMLEEELRLAISLSTIDFERNQALPLVVLDYTYNVNGLGGTLGDSFDVLGAKSFEDWSLGLNVEIPLGNHAAESRVHRAILSRVQRLATKGQRELAIRQEVYDVLDRIETDWQRILAARQAAILAARVLESERRIFDAQDRTSTDVLNAAAELADAQFSEIRALVDYQIAQIDLAFATGTLLGRDRIRWDAISVDRDG